MISECYPNSLPLYASAVSAADRLVQSCITAKNSPWYCWGDAGCEERVLVFVIVSRQNKKGWTILGHWTNIIIVSFVKIQLIYQFALVASLKLYDIIRVALHCVIISYNIQVLHFWSKRNERFSSDWELRYVNIVVAIYDVGYHCVGK